MIITSALSIQDPRERPMDKSRHRTKNIVASTTKSLTFSRCESVELSWRAAKGAFFQRLRRLCRTDYLNYLRVREWQDITPSCVRW